MSEWLELEAKMIFKTILTALPADNQAGRDDEHSQSDRSFFTREGGRMKVGLIEPGCCRRNPIHSRMLEFWTQGEKRRKILGDVGLPPLHTSGFTMKQWKYWRWNDPQDPHLKLGCPSCWFTASQLHIPSSWLRRGRAWSLILWTSVLCQVTQWGALSQGVLWEQSGRRWSVFLVLVLSPLLVPAAQGILQGPHLGEFSSTLTDGY